MTKITEIIPDDMPDWAKTAMEKGQFFNVAIMRAEEIRVDEQERCIKIVEHYGKTRYVNVGELVEALKGAQKESPNPKKGA